MKLISIIDLHYETIQNASLWIVHSGPYSGMTSMVWIPDSIAIAIKDPRLTPGELELMIHQFQRLGLLKPDGFMRTIKIEDFMHLQVTMGDFNQFIIDSVDPHHIHG